MWSIQVNLGVMLSSGKGLWVWWLSSRPCNRGACRGVHVRAFHGSSPAKGLCMTPLVTGEVAQGLGHLFGLPSFGAVRALLWCVGARGRITNPSIDTDWAVMGPSTLPRENRSPRVSRTGLPIGHSKTPRTWPTAGTFTCTRHPPPHLAFARWLLCLSPCPWRRVVPLWLPR